MRVGLDEWSIHHLDISAFDKLALVERLGLEGIQFADARHLSPALDHGEIREVAEEAKRRNLYIEMGIPGLNILRSTKAMTAGKGELVEGYRVLLKAAAAAGSSVIRTFAGGPGDRTHGRLQWSLQLHGATQLAKLLAPLARELGVSLAFETHADVTSFELLRIIEEVGEDVAKVCLDTGNFPIVLEDPLAATRRLAPYVVATHMKDCIVFHTDNGLTVQSRPLGTGILPVSDILAILKRSNPAVCLSIEDNEGLFPVDIFTDGWQEHYEDLQADELTWLIREARRCEERIRNGEIEDPQRMELIPWSAQAEDRIRAAGEYMKRKVQEAVTV